MFATKLFSSSLLGPLALGLTAISSIMDIKQSNNQAAVIQTNAIEDGTAMLTQSHLEEASAAEASSDRLRRVRRVIGEQRAFFSQGGGAFDLGASATAMINDSLSEAAREEGIESFNASMASRASRINAGRTYRNARDQAKDVKAGAINRTIGRFSNMFINAGMRGKP